VLCLTFPLSQLCKTRSLWPNSVTRECKSLRRTSIRRHRSISVSAKMKKGILWFESRLAVPKSKDLKKKILDEAHLSKFSMYPGSTKMYHDLKPLYWWTRIKREIAQYVAKCDTCQRIKACHLKSAGALQPLSIPSWKWDDISMDFIMGLPNTLSSS
jgi:hypothetical protein